LPAVVAERLEAFQVELLERARAFRDANTHPVATLDELVRANRDEGGLLVAGWCGSGDCERQIQAETGATLRVRPFDDELPDLALAPDVGTCVRCGRPAAERAVFARAY
jgi:prolyl-tRNA synthetase